MACLKKVLLPNQSFLKVCIASLENLLSSLDTKSKEQESKPVWISTAAQNLRFHEGGRFWYVY